MSGTNSWQLTSPAVVNRERNTSCQGGTMYPELIASALQRGKTKNSIKLWLKIAPELYTQHSGPTPPFPCKLRATEGMTIEQQILFDFKRYLLLPQMRGCQECLSINLDAQWTALLEMASIVRQPQAWIGNGCRREASQTSIWPKGFSLLWNLHIEDLFGKAVLKWPTYFLKPLKWINIIMFLMLNFINHPCYEW